MPRGNRLPHPGIPAPKPPAEKYRSRFVTLTPLHDTALALAQEDGEAFSAVLRRALEDSPLVQAHLRAAQEALLGE